MLKGLARLLRVYKFEPHVFSSAEAFLDGTVANETTCLIVEFQLGGMCGIELRRRLTASVSTLPVIFITATDDETTRKEALETGCIPYLQKPFPARCSSMRSARLATSPHASYCT